MKLVVIVLLFGLTTLVGASLLDNILPDWNITLPDISIICQNLQFASISEECALQLRIVCANSTLRATFLDASAKFPYDGLAYATRWSYGNFDQCLAIDHEDDEGRILGKHCAVGLTIPDFSGNLSDTDVLLIDETLHPVFLDGRDN
ncbi:hypothetical protein NQ318_013432 [Aromia moschata]|uniref:Nose resistant-to-fluoxetine protein N-terminal domain-containing protein n=1 Tax=Aromia moschata TaxID=1265417 RepID=A0AAV8YNV8_9CUCU|nr:hypothetical protein NQ318_013432 [Aromia moschata]